MSKMVVALLLLALGVALLAGCSGGNDQKVFDWAVDRAAWNGAGSRVAFAALGGNGHPYVWSVDQDGGNRSLLTQSDNDSDLTDEGGNQPAWSPDSADIAIVTSRGTGSQSLYLIDGTGGSNTSEVAITNPATSGADAQPNWVYNPPTTAPYTQLVYVSTKGTVNGLWKPFIVTTSPASIVPVFTTDPSPGVSVQWPDKNGNTVVYQKGMSSRDNDTAIGIYNISTDTEVIPTPTTATNGFRDEQPSLSPTGARIAFSSNRNGSFHIYIMDANGAGSNLTQLTFGSSTDGCPVWSRDGLKILFTRDSEIWSVNVDLTNLHQITQVYEQ
jgi:Tol biopolymer transport system component